MTEKVYETEQTDEFEDWLDDLRDLRARSRVLARITNMEKGNFGDVKPVGEGVSESRIDYGPGYRIYFTKKGEKLILLLMGGDKSTQQSDIEKAKELASNL